MTTSDEIQNGSHPSPPWCGGCGDLITRPADRNVAPLVRRPCIMRRVRRAWFSASFPWSSLHVFARRFAARRGYSRGVLRVLAGADSLGQWTMPFIADIREASDQKGASNA